LELFVFIRFHAQDGEENAVADAIRAVLPPSREEPGCLSIEAFRSVQDGRLFYIHSRWVDEAAFDVHGDLDHTVRFLESVRALVDHEVDVVRTKPLEPIA
jgi:quinol monooxygenase YgiN